MNAGDNFLTKRLPDFCLLVFILTVTVGSFTGGIWASFGIGLALIAFLATWRIEGSTPWPDKYLIGFAFAALAICAALNLRSTQPKLSWEMWGRLATFF